MRREPALIIGAVSAGLSLLVALGIFGLTGDQATAIVAVITAVGGAVTAWRTRPVVPAAFVGVVVALADLAARFHYNVPADVVTGLSGVVVAVLALLTRAQVSPAVGRPALARADRL